MITPELMTESVPAAIVYSIKPLLAVLIPAIAGLLILITGESRRNLREFWTILAASLNFTLILSLLPQALNNQTVICHIASVAANLDFQLRVDSLGIFFALISSGLWIVTSFYSIGFMRAGGYQQQTRYFFCFALIISAAIGIAFSGDLFSLFIFYEILTVSTYPLVVHKETAEAVASGRKYLIYTLSGGALILLAISLTYWHAGSVSFVPGGFLPDMTSGLFYAIFAAFILGFGVKAGLMPMHEWLPSAMVAPTPVSALLHAVAVVKAGVFGILRVLWYVFGPERLQTSGANLIMLYFVGVTVLVAALLALVENNLKRRLAFSTINSLALIILGAALLTESSIVGSMLHLVNHALMKITLFFVAGAIYTQTHKEKVSELSGIGRQMPLTMACFAAASFGLAGLPPFCGFVSKWYLCLGSIESGHLLFLGLILCSALLDIAIFFPIVYRAFFLPPAGEQHIKEAPKLILVPTIFCALLTVVMGIYPNALGRFWDLAKTTMMLLI